MASLACIAPTPRSRNAVKDIPTEQECQNVAAGKNQCSIFRAGRAALCVPAPNPLRKKIKSWSDAIFLIDSWLETSTAATEKTCSYLQLTELCFSYSIDLRTISVHMLPCFTWICIDGFGWIMEMLAKKVHVRLPFGSH